MSIECEKIKYTIQFWIQEGIQLSDTMKSLYVKGGIDLISLNQNIGKKGPHIEYIKS